MPIVKFTSNLKRFFKDIQTTELPGNNVQSLIAAAEKHYKGLSGYLLDDCGHLRPHINIYIGNTLIKDRKGLTDKVKSGESVYIVQAISGG